MKKEIYIAAASGDVEFMKEAGARDVEAAVEAKYTENDFLEVSFQGDNIIHVAAQNGRLEFMKAALAFFSASPNTQMKLLCHTNTDGDTPLHLAATQHTFDIAEHLVTAYLQLRANTGDGDGDDDESKLCGIQNNKGNTPLHVALMNGGNSILVAAYLLGVASQLASSVNHRNETPLHLAVDYDTQGAIISKRNVIKKLNSFGASLDYIECINFEDQSLSFINFLLETAPTAACLRDADGMTPLRRAILNHNKFAVAAIINNCPESVKICDKRGRNIIHYIRYPDFLDVNYFPAISSLVDQQDEDGNTPLHMAIINSDYKMIQEMILANANFAIKNKDGNSPADLILSDSNSYLYKMKDEIKEINNYYVPGELLTAVENKNWEYLLRRLEGAESDEIQFLYRIKYGGNIVHVALRHCEDDYDGEYLNCSNDNEETYSSLQEEFIVEALKKFPILYYQTDYSGCTPLHLAMSRSIMKPGGRAFRTVVEHLRHLKDQPGVFPIPPWVVQTSKTGQTILHLAISFHRYEFAEKLIELDSKLVQMIDHKKQTSLHILCRHDGRRERHEQNVNGMIDLLLEKHPKLLCTYDVEGLTPLMKAVGLCRTRIAIRILNGYPSSIYVHNPVNGKNAFHLMDLDINWDRDFINILPRDPALLLKRDVNGNTPLHIAIEQERFYTAQILMEFLGEEPELYGALNQDGKTPLDMLASAQEVPRQFQDFLMMNRSKLPFELEEVGNSIYGVRYSHIREYMSTVGVVAALLTTITFTAAFTVPGGYDQNKGTPIMARKVAFQVFMLADVVGMCSSMMVLFCLLWFLNSGQVRREGLSLVDLSISLLQLSFYSTLIAFMNGVYVTTSSDIRWLAIFTCVLCTIVLLLMKKRFILDLVVPVFASVITIPTIYCPGFLNRYRSTATI